MQVIESQLVSAGTDVVNPSCKAHPLCFQLSSSRYHALRSIGFNVGGDGLGNMELVGVRIRRLSRFQVQDLPRSQLIILLKETTLGSYSVYLI